MSQKAPGSEFQPCEENDKFCCEILGPSWYNKKVNPETYVHCGPSELLLSNVAHQMKEKLMIYTNNQYFLFLFLSKGVLQITFF